MKPLGLEKLVFRAPEPEDVDVIMALENDCGMMELGLATGPYSRFQIEEFIKQNQNDIYVDRQIRFMIELVNEGIVGVIDLFAFEPRHSRIEVGIAVRKDMRRRGIARLGLQKIEEYCFRVMGIHQIYAYVGVENKASVQLFMTQGFVQSGTLTDWVKSGNRYRDVIIFQKTTPEQVH